MEKIINKYLSQNVSVSIDSDLKYEIENLLSNPIKINFEVERLSELWFIENNTIDSMKTYISQRKQLITSEEFYSIFSNVENFNILIHFIDFSSKCPTKLYDLNYEILTNFNGNGSTIEKGVENSKNKNILKIGNSLFSFQLINSNRYSSISKNYATLMINLDNKGSHLFLGDFLIKYGYGLILNNSLINNKLNFDNHRYNYLFNTKLDASNFYDKQNGALVTYRLSDFNLSGFYQNNFSNDVFPKKMFSGLMVEYCNPAIYSIALLGIYSEINNNKENSFSLSGYYINKRIKFNGEYALNNNKISSISSLILQENNTSVILSYRNINKSDLIKYKISEECFSTGIKLKLPIYQIRLFYNSSVFNDYIIKNGHNFIADINLRLNKINEITFQYSYNTTNSLEKDNNKKIYTDTRKETIKLEYFYNINKKLEIIFKVGTNLDFLKDSKYYFFEKKIYFQIFREISFKLGIFLYYTKLESYRLEYINDDDDDYLEYNNYSSDGYKITFDTKANMLKNLSGKFKLIYSESSMTEKKGSNISFYLQINLKI